MATVALQARTQETPTLTRLKQGSLKAVNCLPQDKGEGSIRRRSGSGAGSIAHGVCSAAILSCQQREMNKANASHIGSEP